MTIIKNNFNVINKLILKDENYNSIIKNFLENYLESNTYIYHPSYIYQLIWNNNINKNEINIIFNDAISNILIQKRQNIRLLIKKDKFKLDSLIQLIVKLDLKIIIIESIL